MDFLFSLVLLVLGCGLVFWLRVLPFREKHTNAPERTEPAELIARRVETGPQRSGRSQGMGYTFILTFRTAAGRTMDLFAYDFEYGALREGMQGRLTWKGPYYVDFEGASA